MATANEIEIRVTVDDKTKGPFAKIERQLKQAGEKGGKEFTKAAEGQMAKLGDGSIRGGGLIASMNKAGQQAGRSFGDGFGKGFNKLKTGSFGRAFGSAATGGLKSLGSIFSGLFGTISSGFKMSLQGISEGLGKLTGGLAGVAQSVATFGAVLALVGAVAGPAIIGISTLAVAIGGTLVSALVGGVGALALFDEKVKEAFKGLGSFVATELGKLSESSGLSKAMLGVVAQLKTAFTQLKPAIEDLMSAAAPQMKILTQGFIDLIENALPGFTAAIEASRPVLEGFAAMLGALGTGLGGFFEQMTLHAEGFKRSFEGIGAIFSEVLPALGSFVGILAEQLGPILPPIATALKDMLNQLGPVFAQAIAELGPLMPGLIQGFTDLLAVIVPMLTPLAEMAVRLLPSLVLAFQSLQPVIEFVAGLFTDVLLPVFDFVIAQVGLFVATLQAAWLAMQGDFEGATRVMTEAGQRLADTLPGQGETAAIGFSTAVDTGMTLATGAVQVNVDEMIGIVQGAEGAFETAGRSMMDALGRGLQSAAGNVLSTVDSIVSQITARLPSSPAKKGPLSGRGYTLYRGRKMAEDFAHGIHKGGAKLKVTTNDLAGNAAFSVFGHKHQRGPDWGRLASGTISGLPTRSAYAGAGAPSASMLGDHYRRQSRQIRDGYRNVAASQIQVTGDADGAIATMISKLIRTGKLRIS